MPPYGTAYHQQMPGLKYPPVSKYHPVARHTINKYSAFFEKSWGARGEEKNFFSREKKFFSSPRLPHL